MKIALYSLWIGLFSLGILPAFSQPSAKKKTIVYTFLSEDLDTALIQFLESDGFFADLEIADIIPFESLRSSLFREGEGQRVLPSSIHFKNGYHQGIHPDSLDIPNLYNTLSFRSGVSIGQIPIRLNAQLVSSNLEIQKQLSSIRIDFDVRTFLARFKPNPHRLMAQMGQVEPSGLASLLESAQEKLFSPEELAILQKEIKFQLYQQIISQPKFEEWMGWKKIAADSLLQVSASQKDRLLQKQKATAYKKAKAEQLLLVYQQSWENRKTYFGDTLTIIKEKLATHFGPLNKSSHPDQLRKKVVANTALPIMTRILAATKQLKIGRSILDDSWYIAKQLPINGLQYQFQTAKVFGGIVYGKQVFNTSFSPVWTNALFSRQDRGKVFFAKAGYDFGASRITYTFIHLKNEGNTSTSFIGLPKSNAVFAINGRTKITKGVQLKSIFSFSRNSWGSTDLSNTRQINGANTAGELTLSGNFLSEKLHLETGYFYVGADYVAAGNPFLQNNQQGLVSKINGRMGKGLVLSGEIKLAQSVDKTRFGGAQKNLQLLGSFNWQATKALSINGQITPNTFKHFGTGDLVLSNANLLYNLQLSSRLAMGRTNLLATGGISNFNNQLNYYDSTLTSQSVYFFTQESLIFTNHSTLSILVLFGVNSAESEEKTHSFFSQLEYGLQQEKWLLQLGSQLLKETSQSAWYYGFNMVSQRQITKQLSLSIDVSWQIPFKKRTSETTRIWTSLELRKQF